MKPFLTGKRAHDAAPLRSLVAQAKTPMPVRHATCPPEAEGPTVEVLKEGDKVVRILVTCACGEKIEIDCLYPPGG